MKPNWSRNEMKNQLPEFSMSDLLLAAAVIVVVWPIYFIRGLFRQRELTQDELLRLEQRKAKKWMDKQN